MMVSICPSPSLAEEALSEPLSVSLLSYGLSSSNALLDIAGRALLSNIDVCRVAVQVHQELR